MRLPLVAACSALLLAGCFTTTADFKNDAENFILETEELVDGLGTTFASATCQEPDNQDVGTTFPCTAIDDEGRSWEFEIEITGSNEYAVNVSRFP
ncbi:MAG: hypothetical protein ACR2O6_04170 [Ilumatobacteraceae bacterium]